MPGSMPKINDPSFDYEAHYTNAEEFPKISVWVTSTGRLDVLVSTIESWIEHCTYLNYEFVIVHSQMTDVSKKFFALEYIDGDATEEYLNSLKKKFPKITFKLFIQPFERLGLTYTKLLENTEGYYINIEDDLRTVTDPCAQLVDNIKLFRADPRLLGIRMDLRDETVFAGCPRFPETFSIEGTQYVIWRQWCSGGAQLMDAYKVSDIGGFITDHAPDQYIQTEHDQSRKMREAGMYTGINLSYYGCLAHIGHHGVQGGDRGWTVEQYAEMAEKGWCGDGTDKQAKKPREHFLGKRKENGLP